MSQEPKSHPDEQHFIPITIDGKPYKAPEDEMTGTQLRQLANIGANLDLFEDIPGPADDPKVGDSQSIHLKPGMHFYTAPKTINPGDVSLPERDVAYLQQKAMKWSTPTTGYLIIHEVPVSVETFDHPSVDILIQIPAAYPMAALDMFYVSPELKLKNGQHPNAANCFEDHCGRRWQRFSRHLNTPQNAWRPGVDSLKTFLALVLGELQGRRS